MLKIELEDCQKHKIALHGMESSMFKMKNCINMYYDSNASNKDSEQLFIDKSIIFIECLSTYVDDFYFNT